MRRGPKPGTGTRAALLPPLERARASWGLNLPPEIEALATACERTSARAAAERIGYSSGLISNMLANKYPGDIDLVFAKIRGAFMGEQVDCPILGAIPTTRCLDEQKRPFAATNSVRARLYHACRTCPFNRKNQEVQHERA